MVGTPQLTKLLAAATAARAKTVLVGDPYQLAPVKARGGMFEQLCDELPWSQRLSEVWRMRDPEERDASLALRSGHGNRLRKAVGWYRTHGRLHTGDPVAMAADAHATPIWPTAKPARTRCWSATPGRWPTRSTAACTTRSPQNGPARAATATSRSASATSSSAATTTSPSSCGPAPGTDAATSLDQVRNGNRWRVAAVDAKTNRIAAERLTDKARVVFEDDYLREHVTLGYAVTVHSAQGVTADTPTPSSARAPAAMAYVGMTRGRDNNEAFIYTASAARPTTNTPRRCRAPRFTAAARQQVLRPRTTSG